MLLNNYLSSRCWQSGFFKCSLQVWRCWSPGSAKASVKNSSSLKPLINDRQVSIHAWHFMQVQSKTICRMVDNSIRLWASTEAQHTCPGKWQRDRYRGDGELYCSAQGTGMLRKKWFGRNLDPAGYFENEERNWLTLPSSLILLQWLFLPGIPLDKVREWAEWLSWLQSRCDSHLWKDGRAMYWLPF